MESVFLSIVEEYKKKFTKDFIQSIITKNGNTQKSERIYNYEMEECLKKLKLTYVKAGSQSPYDFRISVDNSVLLLEVKKTDSLKIFYNDTLPSDNVYYIIIYTGKLKKHPHPCLVYLNGSKLIEDNEWVFEFQKDLQNLKNKYKRIGNGKISVYPRPTYSGSIKKFIENLLYRISFY